MWSILSILLISNVTYLQDDGVVDKDFVWKIEENVNWRNFMADAKNITNGIMQNVEPRLINFLSSVNVSDQCAKSLIFYAEGIKKLEPWAIKMVDATARIPGGFLMGSKIDFGSFEECLAVKKEGHAKELSFQGQFCILGYKSPLFAPLYYKTPHGKNYIEAYGQPPEWIRDKMKEQGGLMRSSGLWLGTCIPSTCSGQDIHNIFSNISKPYASLVSVTDCQVDSKKEFPSSAKIACYFLLGLCGICILGTILDIRGRNISYENEISENFFVKHLKAFSIYANTKKLFGTSTRKSPLDFLRGIRILLCLWVVIGHSFIFPEFWREVKYGSYGELLKFKEKYMVFIENPFLCMECFCVVSGFLLVSSMLKKFEKDDGKVGLMKFFFQKYFRLMPGFMFTFMLLYILPVTNSGPIWNSTWEFEHKKCEQNWWKNFLLINNFSHFDDVCLLHSWYISLTIQLQMFGILLMILTYRYPKAGLLLGVSAISISTYIDYNKSLFYQFRSILIFYAKDFWYGRTFVGCIYMQPFHHIASFIVGMVLAWIFDKFKDFKPSKITLIIGWIISIILSLTMLCITRLPVTDLQITAVYLSTRNFLFGVSFAWLLYCCMTGNGGILNTILSHKILAPFSQLSYLVYLVHPIVLLFREGSRQERMFMSTLDHAFESCAYIVFSLIVSYIGYISVELPCNTICDDFMKSDSSKDQKKDFTRRVKITENEKNE